MHGRGAIDHRQCGLSQNDRGRRERDSNPRYLTVHTISNRAPSATRASLQRETVPPKRRGPGLIFFFLEGGGGEPPLGGKPKPISNQTPSAPPPPLPLIFAT